MSKSDAVYLLLGPEEGEKESFVQQLVERISKSIGEPPEIHRFYAFDSDVSEVLACLRNGTLFSPYRVVLLKNIELISRKGDLDLLAEYAGRPAEQTSFLLISEEIGRVDRRFDKMVAKDNKRIFWEMFESQKIGWLASFFSKKNMRIDPEASAFLLEMVENNTREMRDTCEKLALFYGEGARIGYEEVERVLYHSKDENVFTLFEKLVQRDFPACLEVLAKLLLSREADPVQLLAGILSQVRKLMSLKLLLDSRYSLAEAAARVKLRGKKLQKIYAEGAGHFSVAELEDIVTLIARFDSRVRYLKSSLHSCLLQLFLYYAVVKGGRGCFRF